MELVEERKGRGEDLCDPLEMGVGGWRLKKVVSYRAGSETGRGERDLVQLLPWLVWLTGL